MYATRVHGIRIPVCLMKELAGIPCAACGTTRSVHAVLEGNMLESVMINPLGPITVAVILAVAVCILHDALSAKKWLVAAYAWADRALSWSIVQSLLIALAALNWGWNIYKGL